MSTFDRLWELAHAIDRVDEAERALDEARLALVRAAGWKLVGDFPGYQGDTKNMVWAHPEGLHDFEEQDTDEACSQIVAAWARLSQGPAPAPAPEPEEQEVAK